jgi:NodT family efflux transporter outer membrane factor (OMF) lipoprotein
MIQRGRIFVIAASLLSSGCFVAPKYQKPVAQAPAALKEVAGNDQWKMAAPSDGVMKGKWWEIFGDPELNRLEELVVVNNQNVKQAAAQYQEARAIIAQNHSNYYPTIGGSGTYSENRNYVQRFSQSYSLPFPVSWEPDFWGKVRLSVQNAIANAQVSEADLENIKLSQQALLATDYFLLAAQDMQMQVLARTIESYEKNLQLTINRHAGGVASRSDITLAQTQLSGAKAQYTDTHVARAQDEHAIAVLTGQPPAALEIATTEIHSAPPPIPIAIPSQLLERRPDIAANERQVAAANANIGIAKAAYYPTVTLTATPGLLYNNLLNLLTYKARSWAAGASINETIFDFGRRRSALQLSEAEYDATVAAYRQTVLAAFQEVEDDLSTLRYLAEEAGQQQEAVVAAREAVELETQRYRAGTDSYLNVITTQIIALGDEQNAITILQRRMTAAVDLVKAVGGGWDASKLPSDQELTPPKERLLPKKGADSN